MLPVRGSRMVEMLSTHDAEPRGHLSYRAAWCDGCIGFRRPSERGVCVLFGDGGEGCRGQIWWPCGLGSRIGFSGCAWMADRCVCSWLVPQIKVRNPSGMRLGGRTLCIQSGLSTRLWHENANFYAPEPPHIRATSRTSESSSAVSPRSASWFSQISWTVLPETSACFAMADARS